MLNAARYNGATETSMESQSNVAQCGSQAFTSGERAEHSTRTRSSEGRKGPEPLLAQIPRELRYATDGGVRLAGGRMGEERDAEVPENLSEGSTYTMPPPYPSISFL